jgi:glycosyltransferase involved in cell wall biosynthesis
MIAHTIAEGLVKRGHKIFFFASGDSKTSGKLMPTSRMATSKDPRIGFSSETRQYLPYELIGLSIAFAQAKKLKLDVIHSHLDFQTSYFSNISNVPTAITLHSRLLGMRADIMSTIGKAQHYISISNAQRRALPKLNYAATIYHGIDWEKIAWSETPEEKTAVIVARVHKVKGIAEAIKAAKKAGFKLTIIGSHNESDPYWKNKVKPRIDGKKIVYKDFIPQEKVFEIIRNSKVFIFPLQWEEPFGLVLIEALACGTPVISFSRGSIPEIVKNGKNGYLVKDINQMAAAMKKIDIISRKACRKYVEKNFGLDKMIDQYERLFQRLTNQ